MRAVIFANGAFRQPSNPLAALHADDYLIAADGGTHHCIALGLRPNVVIGDMDSISETVRESLSREGTQFMVHPRDKDETDLELALEHAVSKGCEDILLLGLLGGRLDQTLANLLVLTRPEWRPARLTAADGPDFATLLRDGEEVQMEAKGGNTISLIPLSPMVSGVTTQGLRWSLEDVRLEFGSTLGISNETTGEVARVRIEEGLLLVVQRSDQ
ncbi:MAG TPA: thiamine diphosphokinase [Anaerolineales bacterium]